MHYVPCYALSHILGQRHEASNLKTEDVVMCCPVKAIAQHRGLREMSTEQRWGDIKPSKNEGAQRKANSSATLSTTVIRNHTGFKLINQ